MRLVSLNGSSYTVFIPGGRFILRAESWRRALRSRFLRRFVIPRRAEKVESTFGHLVVFMHRILLSLTQGRIPFFGRNIMNMKNHHFVLRLMKQRKASSPLVSLDSLIV